MGAPQSGFHRGPEIENVLGDSINREVEVKHWCMWDDAACSVSTLGGWRRGALGAGSLGASWSKAVPRLAREPGRGAGGGGRPRDESVARGAEAAILGPPQAGDYSYALTLDSSIIKILMEKRNRQLAERRPLDQRGAAGFTIFHPARILAHAITMKDKRWSELVNRRRRGETWKFEFSTVRCG